jgi:hypothetical protein
MQIMGIANTKTANIKTNNKNHNSQVMTSLSSRESFGLLQETEIALGVNTDPFSNIFCFTNIGDQD